MRVTKPQKRGNLSAVEERLDEVQDSEKPLLNGEPKG